MPQAASAVRQILSATAGDSQRSTLIPGDSANLPSGPKGDLVLKVYMEVSTNGGTPPSWMVLRENPMKIDDSGVPPFMETTI